ncbi:MAG: hypothetical protein DRJ26_03750 [Candidatus Methanomethylicota archaeon]|mgnify:CR=1 FL=1|uniref:Sjogrens syndrome scleroderma autoantigen 1 n=1 Tax=Thermoproteota archaeon TaxID=2056631 RepID=A0A497F2L0_9CREN|nr:MAG: hypothetical protein DRJ26_03750 [Candidatus Verstraetearchaeota archaeon]
MDDDRAKLKEMADLLRSGATMLPQICPECSAPLFKLKTGEIICPVCKRKVIFTKESEQIKELSIIATAKLEEVLSFKLLKVAEEIEKTDDIDKLCRLAELAKSILDIIVKIRR